MFKSFYQTSNLWITQYKCRRFSRLLFSLAFFVSVLLFNVKAQSPGGISTGIRFWFDDSSVAGFPAYPLWVNTWTNKVSVQENVSIGNSARAPDIHYGICNFNTGVVFDGDDYLRSTKTQMLDFVTANSNSAFLVRTKNQNTTADGIEVGAFSEKSVFLGTRRGNFAFGQANNNALSFLSEYDNDNVNRYGGITNKNALVSVITSSSKVEYHNNNRIVASSTSNPVVFENDDAYFAMGGEPWDLDTYSKVTIAEYIAYKKTLTAAERHRVESYLAIKFGISFFDLSFPTPVLPTYYNSAGQVIWNGSANGNYVNRITAIGRDDLSGLNQKQSITGGEPYTTGRNIEISMGLANVDSTNTHNTATFSADKKFMFWADDNDAKTSYTNTESIVFYPRIAREWKITDNGVGTVELSIPKSFLPSSIRPIYLLVDSDGDFSSGAKAYAMNSVTNYNGQPAWSRMIDFQNGDYFTFAEYDCSKTAHVYANICQGSSYLFGGTNRTTSGTYSALGSTTRGCDSTTILHLTVIPAAGVTYNGCEGDGYFVVINGVKYDENNPTGSISACGGTRNINLSFKPKATSSFTYLGCLNDGFSTVINGTTYNQSKKKGIEQFTAANGCDSSVLVNLVYDNCAALSTDTCVSSACLKIGKDISDMEESSNFFTSVAFNQAIGGMGFKLCSEVNFAKIAHSTVTFPALFTAIANLKGGTAAEALTKNITFDELATALIASLQAKGDVVAANEVIKLRTCVDESQTFQLGQYITIDAPLNSISTIGINSLDILMNGAQTLNYNRSSFATGSIVLGSKAIGFLELASYNMSVPTMACGLKGVTYCSGGLRLKLQIGFPIIKTIGEVLSAIIPENPFLDVNFEFDVGNFGMFFEIGQSCYTITDIAACDNKITGIANPGGFKGYWGVIPDSIFFDKNQSIQYPEDVEFMQLAKIVISLELGLPFLPKIKLPIGVGVGLKAAEAELTGVNPPKVLSGPFPNTACDGLSAGAVLSGALAACAASAQFDIDIILPFVGPLIGDIVSFVLNGVIRLVGQLVLGLLTPILSLVLDPILEPLLGLMGPGLGSACATVYGLESDCVGAETNLVYAGCQGDGYSVEINGNTYDESNPTGMETLKNVAGCDSIVTIAFTFNEIRDTINYTGCAGDGYCVNVRGTTYSVSNPTGVEVFPGGSQYGCDSTVVINLSYTAGVVNEIADTVCVGSGYSILVNGVTYNQSNPTGTEVISGGAVNGCDSIINVNLFYLSSVPKTYSYAGCTGSGFSITIGGVTFNEGNPTGTALKPGAICDTLYSVNLVFAPIATGVENYVGCKGDGYGVLVNGVIYDESNPTGVETLVGASAAGCDSIVTINLVYNTTDCFVAVGNLVFLDNNANGMFDGGDVGVDGVIVDLYGVSGELGIFSPIKSDTTSGGGYYLFDELNEGDYRLYLPASNFEPTGALYNMLSSSPEGQDTNLDDNADENGQNTLINGGVGSSLINLSINGEATGEAGQGSYSGILEDNDVNMTVDFGFYSELVNKVAIGNLIFMDFNSNSSFDFGTDMGLDGVRVELYTADQSPGVDDPILVDTSSAGGFYEFDMLDTGSYIVYLPPSNFFTGGVLNGKMSAPLQGGDTNTDDNIDENGQNTFIEGGISSTPIQLSSGQEAIGEVGQGNYTGILDDANVNFTVDFGLIDVPNEKVAIGNVVFMDLDYDFVFTDMSTDTGVVNVVVELYTDTQNPGIDAPLAVDTTDNNGFYLFDQLDPGYYVVYLPESNFSSGGVLFGAENIFGQDSDNGRDDNLGENGRDSLLNGGVASGLILLMPNTEPINETGMGVYSGVLDDDNVDMTVDFGFTRCKKIAFIEHEGCANDGYSVEVDGVLYDVNNPIGIVASQTLNGCDSITFVGLTFYETPELVTKDTFVCMNEQVWLNMLYTSNTLVGPMSYYASYQDALDSTNAISPNIYPATSTRYYIRQDATVGGCYDVDSMFVKVSGTPLIDVAATYDTICPGGRSIIESTPINGSSACTIQWQRDSSGIWVDIMGAINTYYQTDTLLASSDYRARYVCEGCMPEEVISDVVHIEVQNSANCSKVGLGNLVYFDNNDDGAYDSATESLIPGVTLQLFAAGADPSSAIPIAVDTTDELGSYLFDNLDPGSYFVYIPSSNFVKGNKLYRKLSSTVEGGDNGLDDTQDENGQNTFVNGGIQSSTIVLASGAEPTMELGEGMYNGLLGDDDVDMTVDFGFLPCTQPYVGENLAICSGDSVTIVAYPSISDTMTTEVGDWEVLLSGSTTASITSLLGADSITIVFNNPTTSATNNKVVFTNTMGCFDTMTVRVFAIPQVQAMVDTICQQSETTIDPGAFFSYEWSTGAFTRQITEGSGTYILTVTNILGCSAVMPYEIVAKSESLNIYPDSLAMCMGGSTTLSTSFNGTTGTCGVQWQYLNGATWTNIVGATDSVYATGPLTETTYFRAVATCSPPNCPILVSDTAFVDVVNSPNLNFVGGDVDICVGGTISLSANHTGGTPVDSYEWQVSTDSINYTAIPGATESVFNSSGILETSFFRVIIRFTGLGCDSLISAGSKTTVHPDPAISITASDTTVCGGGSSILTAHPIGGIGTTNLTWQRLNTGFFQTIAGATDSVYTTPILTGDETYLVRYTATGGGCSVAYDTIVLTHSTIGSPIVLVTDSLCNENGTAATSTDDYFTISLDVSNPNPGGTGKYLVYRDGILLNPGGTDYGTSFAYGAGGELAADGTSMYEFTISDMDSGVSACSTLRAIGPISTCSGNCPIPICFPIQVFKY